MFFPGVNAVRLALKGGNMVAMLTKAMKTGGFLIVTGLKFLRNTQEEPSLERNLLVRAVRRVWPVTESYEGQKFFVRRDGGRSSSVSAGPG